VTRAGALAVLALLCLCPWRVAAWGAEGHHLVARVAWSQMSDAARRAATDLLGGDDFVASSTWADEVRSLRPETYNWHFVDIPYDATNYDPARDCAATPRGDCVVAAITREIRDITDTSLSKDKRKEALKFLIHFVGDLHQPLHSIDNHDKGGNDVRVSLTTTPSGRPTNLHSIWDSAILSARGMDEEAYGKFLVGDLSHLLVRSGSDIGSWALESHQIAVDAVYKYEGFSSTGPPSALVVIDSAYLTKAMPIVDRQLETAGVRLAHILNDAFRPALAAR
jgi:hypothetical protein